MARLSRRSTLSLLTGISAVPLLLGAQAARADEYITILTGGTSGVYYPLGVALTKIFGDTISGVRPSVQSTKASVENLNLLNAGKGELAFTLGDSLRDAWAGNTEVGFKAPLKKLRGIAAIYANYIQLVASKDLGIKTLADLKGKRVSVGAPKSGTELNARTILTAAGITYEDLGKVEYLPFGESGRAHEEPAARRDPAVGRTGRGLDPRPLRQRADPDRRDPCLPSSRRWEPPTSPRRSPPAPMTGRTRT